MTNKYIEIEMMPTTCGIGDSFSTEASLCLDNFKAPFYDIEVKIDTGCSISAIPLKRLKVTNTLCKTLKRNISIGMNILKDWDIHIGFSKVTGKSLLLTCPMENEYGEYIDALEMHFGNSFFSMQSHMENSTNLNE